MSLLKPPKFRSTDVDGKEASRVLFGKFIWVPVLIVIGTIYSIFNPNENEYDDLQVKASRLYKSQKYAEAIPAFSRCIEIKPEVAQNHYNRGLCKMQLQDFVGAVVDIEEGIRLGTRSNQRYLHLGWCLMYLKKWEAAADAFDKSVQNYGKYNDYIARAETRLHLGDTTGAQADFDYLFVIWEEDKGKLFYHIGNIYNRLGMPVKACSNWKQAWSNQYQLAGDSLARNCSAAMQQQ